MIRMKGLICILRLGFLVVSLAAGNVPAAVTFNFTYFNSMANPNTGFFDPVLGAARRAALEAVAADIGSKIGQTATVEVGVAPSLLTGTGFIGTANQTFLNAAAPAAGIFDGEVYRRIVLGEPDNNPGFDGGLQFNFGYNVALSGTPAAGQAYMPDVFRHELTHMLGYGSLVRANGRGRNNQTPDVYSRFDSFLRTGAGQPLIDNGGNLLLSLEAFTTAYTAGVRFDGPATRAANEGEPLLFYFSDTTHSRNPADVMYVSPAVGYVRDAWSERDIAVLRDLGYVILPGSPVPPLFLKPFTFDGSGFGFKLSTQVNQSYRIQASTNLSDWMEVTNFVATADVVTVLDSSAINASPRFYRSVTP